MNGRISAFFIVVMFFINVGIFSQDPFAGKDQAIENLEMKLLEFKASNSDLCVSEEPANTYNIMEGKSLKIKITLFLMSAYGVIVATDNNTESSKIEIFNDNQEIIAEKVMKFGDKDILEFSAEYTGEYLVKITPLKVLGSDSIKMSWISWAVLYDDY